MRIKKGDRVRVLTGKDRGKEGIVLTAMPAVGKVVVEGVNTARKHQKRTRATMDAGLLNIDMPIPVANVAVLSPQDGKPTRVGYRIDADGTKVRVCKRTGAEI
jgi:large subunit ribosomal protein L24